MLTSMTVVIISQSIHCILQICAILSTIPNTVNNAGEKMWNLLQKFGSKCFGSSWTFYFLNSMDILLESPLASLEFSSHLPVYPMGPFSSAGAGPSFTLDICSFHGNAELSSFSSPFQNFTSSKMKIFSSLLRYLHQCSLPRCQGSKSSLR